MQLRKLVLIACFVCFAVIMITPAGAQQLDVAFGVRTVTAPAAEPSIDFVAPQSITGGAYPTFSADYLFLKNFGVGGEVSWRASRSVYAGFQPYRPIFYDFNAVFAPPLGKHAQAELQAGIGAESVRFYQPFFTCGFTGCTNYTSSNHFMGHFGGGVRFFVHGPIFIRPEAHLYLVHNNVEFSSSRAGSFGLSIGFSSRSERY
jgi:hypothetical protein